MFSRSSKHEKRWVCCCVSAFLSCESVVCQYSDCLKFIFCVLDVLFFKSALRTFLMHLLFCLFSFSLLLHSCFVTWCIFITSLSLSALHYLISQPWHLFFYIVCALFLSLPPQLSVAMEEKLSLQAETRSLKERLSHCDSLDASTTVITGKKLLLLQSQMEQLQEENYRYKQYTQFSIHLTIQSTQLHKHCSCVM